MEKEKTLMYAQPRIVSGSRSTTVASTSDTNSYKENPAQVSFEACGVSGVTYLDSKNTALSYPLCEEGTLGFSLVYNSDPVEIGELAVADDIALCTNIQNYIGTGFKLSLDRYVFCSEGGTSSEINERTYCYVDGSGNTQEFLYAGKDNGWDAFLDTHNNEIKLRVDDDNETISLHDKYGNVVHFSMSTGRVYAEDLIGGRTRRYSSNFVDGRFNSLIDSIGTNVTFNYNNSMVSSIVCKT